MKTFGQYTDTYNGCRICGREPRTERDEPNKAPIRFWEPDDGWVISALCRNCFHEFGAVQPHVSDYAYRDEAHQICSVEDTDLDAMEAL